MKRSKLKNKANKTKDPTDIKNYKKQRNYVVNLNKEAKLEYFSKYESDDNKPFWVRCKPYFTNKYSKADTDIILSENGELILKNKEIANTFNDHFASKQQISLPFLKKMIRLIKLIIGLLAFYL